MSLIALLACLLASCGDDTTNTIIVQPPEGATVLNQLQARYMGDAVDGKTADLRLAFFNGAYGAEVEGADYEALMIEAIDDMPESFASFAMKPGKYTFTNEYSGIPGEFVGGSREDGELKGSYYVKSEDGVKTTYLITGGEFEVIKGVSYVVKGRLFYEGVANETRLSPLPPEIEFYYSGPIAFENKDIPEGAIVVEKFYPEYFGDIFSTGTAFFALSCYNGFIDFDKGPAGAFDLFVLEAFNELPADETEFEVSDGEYTIYVENRGTEMKYIEGDPSYGSYKGTFYLKVDELGNSTAYMFTSGTVKISRYGNTYKMVTDLDGYVFNPADEEDTSNIVENVVIYYYGSMEFDIEPKPEVKPYSFNDGEGYFWGDADGPSSDKVVLTLRRLDMSDPETMSWNMGITLYTTSMQISDPNLLIESISIPEGTYNLSNSKAPFTFMPGAFNGEYSTSGTYYFELGHDGGAPPKRMAVITEGKFTVKYSGEDMIIETFFKGKDYQGNDFEMHEWWYQGQLKVIDKRPITEQLKPVFTKASLVYKKTVGNVGFADLLLTSDEFSGGGYRYELKMEVRMFSIPEDDDILLIPVEYAADTGQTEEFMTFKMGSFDPVSPTSLYPSYYKQISPDGNVVTAPVPIIRGTMEASMYGNGYKVDFRVGGQNLRTQRDAELNFTYTGPISVSRL